MKELSIEEKAKCYDEAIERAQSLKNKWIDEDGEDVAFMIFPELKESEDAKIVRCLLNYFHHVRYNGLDLKGTNVDEVIAWLEKQGEQKSAWSEEDALRLEEAIYMIKARGWIRGDDAVKLVLDWLKSLKDRVSPQPKTRVE